MPKIIRWPKLKQIDFSAVWLLENRSTMGREISTSYDLTGAAQPYNYSMRNLWSGFDERRLNRVDSCKSDRSELRDEKR